MGYRSRVQNADPYIITVRYAGKCAETGKDLKAGDKALYFPREKKMYHTDSKEAQRIRGVWMDRELGYDY
jgi:hypothetical protein